MSISVTSTKHVYRELRQLQQYVSERMDTNHEYYIFSPVSCTIVSIHYKL